MPHRNARDLRASMAQLLHDLIVSYPLGSVKAKMCHREQIIMTGRQEIGRMGVLRAREVLMARVIACNR
jgi:hypothetical protein